MTRAGLPARRAADAVRFEHLGHVFRIQVGFYPGGDIIGEVFINAEKNDSAIDAIAGDIAILLSLLLQHGATLGTIGHALRRNPNGSRASLIGALVDRLDELFGTAPAAASAQPQAGAVIDAIYRHLKDAGFLVTQEAIGAALRHALQPAEPTAEAAS